MHSAPKERHFHQMTREELVQMLIGWVARMRCFARALLVAIEGIDLSGKTRLTMELASALKERGEKVVVIHCDDFLNPRAVRYRQGELSPRGFLEDFFDYECLKRKILEPARACKSVTLGRLVIDEEDDSVCREIVYEIDTDSVVLVEGLFLLRPELKGSFDLAVRLKIPDDVVVARALSRDVPRLGDRESVLRHYSIQVLPAHNIYEQSCKPDLAADLILDTSDVNRLQVLQNKNSTRRN